MKDRGIGITDELSPRPMNHGAHRPSQHRPTASYLPRTIDVCVRVHLGTNPLIRYVLLILVSPFLRGIYDRTNPWSLGFSRKIARLVGAHLSMQRKADSYLPRDFLKFDGGSYDWKLRPGDSPWSGMRNG